MQRLSRFKVWLLCPLLLAFVAVIPVYAQAGITIGSVELTCLTAQITYTIDPPAASGGVLVNAFANAMQIGGMSAPNTGGTHTVVIEYEPQADGTPITFIVANDVANATTTLPCSTATPPTSEPPPADDEIPTPPTETGSAWEGWTDGRITPDPAEYYTIYCANNIISVWRSVPRDEEIKQVSISLVQILPENGILTLGDGMALVRNTEETLTIYGSNGNLAPEPGGKAFSYSDCIRANAASLPPTDTPASAPNPPQDSGGSGGVATAILPCNVWGIPFALVGMVPLMRRRKGSKTQR
jgi:hypothetical protein